MTKMARKKKDTKPPKLSSMPVDEKDFNSVNINKLIVPKFKPRNTSQQNLYDLIDESFATFILGKVGTGKTYVAVHKALEMLSNKEIKKIIILRPTVATDENLGYLKGDLKEKVYPYVLSIIDPMIELLGKIVFDKLVENGTISIEAIGFMKGRSLKHTFVITDEVQNCTPEQLRVLLSRIEDTCKMTFSGDSQQIDLKKGIPSASHDLDRFLNKKGIGFHVFNKNDIVRGKFTQIIDSCYPEYNQDDEIDDYDKYAKKIKKPKSVKAVKTESEIETYDYNGHWQ